MCIPRGKPYQVNSDGVGITPENIRIIGLELLKREFGPDGMIEFLQQYSLGSRNYTKEREKKRTAQIAGSSFVSC